MPDSTASMVSRHSLLTLITVLTMGGVLILTGLQARHNWPVTVADGTYVGAVAIVVWFAARIYRYPRI